jgi:hypothetical protein
MAQNVAQSIFCQNDNMTFSAVKSCLKMRAKSANFQKKTTQRNLSVNRRKFAQSGHPARFPQCWITFNSQHLFPNYLFYGLARPHNATRGLNLAENSRKVKLVAKKTVPSYFVDL